MTNYDDKPPKSNSLPNNLTKTFENMNQSDNTITTQHTQSLFTRMDTLEDVIHRCNTLSLYLDGLSQQRRDNLYRLGGL